jgi:hypothetical protein
VLLQVILLCVNLAWDASFAIQPPPRIPFWKGVTLLMVISLTFILRAVIDKHVLL